MQLPTISLKNVGTLEPWNQPEKRVALERPSLLKSEIKAFDAAKQEFTTCLATLDTGASMPLVRVGSPYILRGQDLHLARSRLEYLSDELLLKAIDQGKSINVRTAKGAATLKQAALITLMLNGEQLTMPALVVKPECMPTETEVVVDRAAIQDSGLLHELAYLSESRQAWQRRVYPEPGQDATPESGEGGMIHKGFYPCNVYVPKSAKDEGKELENRKSTPVVKGLEDTHTSGVRSDGDESRRHEINEDNNPSKDSMLLREVLRAEVMLSEANCRLQLEENPNIFEQKSLSLSDIDVAPTLLPAESEQVAKMLERYQEVFAKNDGLPKAMNEKFAPRVKLIRDPTVKKAFHPKPKWGKYQEAVLRAWAKSNLENGFLEEADSSVEYAMRPHICPKPGGKGLRVAFDATMANKAFPKLPINLTNMEDQLRRHRGAKYFLQTDALRGYHQILLDDDSKDICAIWTPQGLLRRTRLVEGLKNSGTAYQGPITRVLDEMHPAARASTSNYMDDFLVSGKTFEEFTSNVKEFFRVCELAGITLSPKKTKLGYDTAKMVGRELHGNTITVHDDNLKAVRQAVEPTDKQQLKRFLGVCQYAAKHVKDYAKIARPLFKLTSKKAEWTWQEGGPEQLAWKKLKDVVAEKFRLETPDYSKPMYLFTDASDDGMGAHLCQFQNDKGEVVALSDEEIQVVGDERKRTLAFYSGAFDEAMRRKPVFYREARAMIWAMTKAKEFIDKCAHELVVVTDHQPLKWIQQSERGQVTASTRVCV